MCMDTQVGMCQHGLILEETLEQTWTVVRRAQALEARFTRVHDIESHSRSAAITIAQCMATN